MYMYINIAIVRVHVFTCVTVLKKLCKNLLFLKQNRKSSYLLQQKLFSFILVKHFLYIQSMHSSIVLQRIYK